MPLSSRRPPNYEIPAADESRINAAFLCEADTSAPFHKMTTAAIKNETARHMAQFLNPEIAEMEERRYETRPTTVDGSGGW